MSQHHSSYPNGSADVTCCASKDENFDVIYTNEKIKREEWRTFQVGETRFNDDATRRAGEQSPLLFLILMSRLGTIHGAHAN